MNKRLRHILTIFYRLAQIEMLNETQIYIILRIEKILKKNKKQPISIKSLARNTPDISQKKLNEELHALDRLKYLKIKNDEIQATRKFFKQVLYD